MSEVTDLLSSIASKASLEYTNLLFSSRLGKADFLEILKTLAKKSEVNEAFSIKANAEETQTALGLKANRSEVYSISETISLLEAFVGAKVVRTIAERDALETGIYRYIWVLDPSADAEIEEKEFPALYMWHSYDRITGSYLYLASAIHQLDLNLLNELATKIGEGFTAENTVSDQISEVRNSVALNTESISTLSITVNQMSTRVSELETSLGQFNTTISAALTGKADLSGAAFTGAVSILGVTLTPNTQLTIDQKAAMTAANAPSVSNPVATINDLRSINDLGWFATESTLNLAYPTGINGQHAIVGTTDTVWVWDEDTTTWFDSGKKGAVTSVNNYTGSITLVKADLGLGYVDNTSDMDKPISTAVQAALDSIQGISSITVDSHYFIGDGTAENPLQLSEEFLSDFMPSLTGLSYLDDGRIVYTSNDSGVDDNTLALFHFDGIDLMQNDGSADVNAVIINTTQVNQGTDGKFSKCFRAYGAVNNTNNTGWTTRGFAMDLPAISGDWTLDFWIYADSDTVSSFNIGTASGGMFPILNNYRSSWTDSGITWQTLVNTWPLPTNSELPIGSRIWKHVALVQYGDIFRVFLNGTIHFQATATNVTLQAGRYLMACGTANWCYVNIDEFRFSNIARYTTESFVPQNVQYGTPVISYALSTTKISDLMQMASTTVPGRMSAADKAKLDALTGDPAFPDSPDVGDVMLGKSGADLGNNINTKFLLQPITSTGEIADTAFGNVVPNPVVNVGLTVDEDGNLVFGMSKYAQIPASSLSLDVLVPDHDWTIDLVVKITAVTGSTSFGSSQPFFGIVNNHATLIGIDVNTKYLYFSDDSGRTSVPYVLGTWAHLTWEYYYDQSSSHWKQARYLDGQLLEIKDNAVLNNECYRTGIYSIGSMLPYASDSVGVVRVLKIRNNAPYRGTSFIPQALPWVSSGPNYWAKTGLADVKNMLDQISGNERRISINTKSFTGTRHLLLEASSHADYSVSDELINTLAVAEDRANVYAVSSSGVWANCPSGGFDTDYQNSVVYAVLDNTIDFNTLKYIRYKWFNVAAVASYQLSGAGSTNVNNTFYPAQEADVTNYYGTTIDNIWLSSDKTCQMFKDTAAYYGSDWVIVETASGMPYYSGSGATPDVATWSTYVGESPVPTVEVTTTEAADDGWNYTIVGSVQLQPLQSTSSSDTPAVPEEDTLDLLLEPAVDKDMLICREGVDRGNNVDTRLLVQPINAEGTVTDSAYGNPAPIALVNNGVTVDENGDLVFDGNGYIDVGENKLPDTVLDVDKEWTLDVAFYATDNTRVNTLFGYGGAPRLDFLLSTSGGLSIGGGPDFGSGWIYNTWHLFTFELYLDGETWKWTGFKNGAIATAGTWGTAAWRAAQLAIGADTTSLFYRNFVGKMHAVRLQQGAIHRGQAFTPQDLPWLTPGKEWQRITVAELKAELKIGTMSRYAISSLPDLTTVDYLDGEHQVCTTTNDVEVTIVNLPINTGMVLDINNAAGKTVTFGTTNLLTPTETGRYPLAFYNDNGTVFAIVNGAFVS